MAILARIAQRLPRARRAMLCALLMMAAEWNVGTSVSIAEEPLASEYQVKAAFLVNFPKYADWPAEAFAGANSPIIIAVLGNTPLNEELQKVVAGRTINGRQIFLKHLTSDEEYGVCHILFVSAGEERHLPEILAKLKDTSVLTVGESDDFLEGGGMIDLARRDRKIALEVNLIAANKAHLKVSSKLLNVASLVKTK